MGRVALYSQGSWHPQTDPNCEPLTSRFGDASELGVVNLDVHEDGEREGDGFVRSH